MILIVNKYLSFLLLQSLSIAVFAVQETLYVPVKLKRLYLLYGGETESVSDVRRDFNQIF